MAIVTIMCCNDDLSWLFTNRLSATRYLKVKKMGIKKILRRIWLFSASKIKISESVSKQPTQVIVKLNSSLRHKYLYRISEWKPSWTITIIVTLTYSDTLYLYTIDWLPLTLARHSVSAKCLANQTKEKFYYFSNQSWFHDWFDVSAKVSW